MAEAGQGLAQAAVRPPERPPRLLHYHGLYAGTVAVHVDEGLQRLIAKLGPAVSSRIAPAEIAAYQAAHKCIYDREFAENLCDVVGAHKGCVGIHAAAAVSRGRDIAPDAYAHSLAVRTAAIAFFDRVFADFDAILAPSATDEAPVFEDGTGDAACSTVWSLCGLPCVTLPLLQGPKGLPVGVQLIGAKDKDAIVLQAAAWLEAQL